MSQHLQPGQSGDDHGTWPEIPCLETERLWLRRWSQEDSGEYRRILGDPEVMRYMGSGVRFKAKRAVAGLLALVSDVETRRNIDRLTSHWRRFGFGEWAVEERPTGALIGKIGLVYHPDWVADPAKVEIGWLLARRAWGQGFATEGAHASLAFAFERLGMERIISITKPENRRSLRVMERLGLSLKGRTRWRGGDVVWCAIDRATWERH